MREPSDDSGDLSQVSRGRRKTVLTIVAVLSYTLAALLLVWAFISYQNSETESNTPMPTPTATFTTTPTKPAAKSQLSTKSEGEGCGQPASLKPNRLYYPRLCVDAGYTPATVVGEAMTLPADSETLSRYTGDGLNIVAGHVNWKGTVGVFSKLVDAKPGDRIVLTGEDGIVSQWEVVSLNSYDKGALPEDLYTINPSKLWVVTCGGNLIDTPQGRRYEKNIVLGAVLTQ